MTRIADYICIRCSASFPADIRIDSRGCVYCFKSAPSNLRPRYIQDGNAVNETKGQQTPHASLWRHTPTLPHSQDETVSLGEGQTPLLHASRIGKALGIPRLFIKDEGRNPTWSLKDRFSKAAVCVAKSQGARVVATASSGNAGASLAAYAARAGLRCVVATFAGNSEPMFSHIRKYQAAVVPLFNKADRWKLLCEAADRFGWFVTSPYRAPVVGSHPAGIEGYKTIAYEIVDQLHGEAPDWCVMPVCYGDALAGVWYGFKELFEAGRIDRLPRLVAAEVHGSLEAALAQGQDRVEEKRAPFETLAVSIKMTRSTYQAIKALRESSGHAVSINNHGLADMQGRLAASEGIFGELASVTPFVALRRLRNRSVIQEGDLVVAVITASGLKDLDRSSARSDPGDPFQTIEDAWSWLQHDGYV